MVKGSGKLEGKPVGRRQVIGKRGFCSLPAVSEVGKRDERDKGWVTQIGKGQKRCDGCNCSSVLIDNGPDGLLLQLDGDDDAAFL